MQEEPPSGGGWETLLGGGCWIRTIEGNAGRFTVCSLWPLGQPSAFLLVLRSPFRCFFEIAFVGLLLLPLLARGLEPLTPCLQGRCSAVELRQPTRLLGGHFNRA